MELQVRHLRVICEIAAMGSLNRAATRLGLGQPALSHQLRRIETAVGGTLFRRSQNGVLPTALGVVVLRRARAIVRAFDELERDFHRQEAVGGDTIRVGWNDSELTGPLFGALADLLPDARLHTRADVSRTRLLAQVAGGGIDIALVMICGRRPLTVPPGVHARTIAREPAFAAVPAAHPLADRAEIALADLADADWVVSSCGDGCRVVFREMCMAHGFEPRISHDVDVTASREGLVVGGHGVTLVQPTRAQRPGLAIRPLTGSPMVVRHALAWRADGPAAACAPELGTRLSAEYWRVAERNPGYRAWLSHNNQGFSEAS